MPTKGLCNLDLESDLNEDINKSQENLKLPINNRMMKTMYNSPSPRMGNDQLLNTFDYG